MHLARVVGLKLEVAFGKSTVAGEHAAESKSLRITRQQKNAFALCKIVPSLVQKAKIARAGKRRQKRNNNKNNNKINEDEDYNEDED